MTLDIKICGLKTGEALEAGMPVLANAVPAELTVEADREQLFRAVSNLVRNARELRRAKDQEEFDRFMANRKSNPPAPKSDPESNNGPNLLDD